MIKNSQPFGKNIIKPQGDFFDSHCTSDYTRDNGGQKPSVPMMMALSVTLYSPVLLTSLRCYFNASLEPTQ